VYIKLKIYIIKIELYIILHRDKRVSRALTKILGENDDARAISWPRRWSVSTCISSKWWLLHPLIARSTWGSRDDAFKRGIP